MKDGEGCQQPTTKSLTILCLAHPYPQAQHPTYSNTSLKILSPKQEANKNAIPERGKSKCDLLRCWLRATNTARVLFHRYVFRETLLYFWNWLLTCLIMLLEVLSLLKTISHQLLPSTPPWPLKIKETAWFIRLCRKFSAITSSLPLSILCQFHLTNYGFLRKRCQSCHTLGLGEKPLIKMIRKPFSTIKTWCIKAEIVTGV